MYSKINRRLRAARLERFWTIEEAAQEVGVCAQTYLRWEQYKQMPHISSLELLCKTFCKSPEELGYSSDGYQ